MIDNGLVKGAVSTKKQIGAADFKTLLIRTAGGAVRCQCWGGHEFRGFLRYGFNKLSIEFSLYCLVKKGSIYWPFYPYQSKI